MSLFEEILRARGLQDATRESFLHPDYGKRHDPFLLPDMAKAVDRLVAAREKQERITIYGDYDIDGLTATTLLVDALGQFGFRFVETFIPNRFVEGYGMTVDAVERIAASGAQLILTVDCGSLSEKEIVRANELGVDVIVTDHHNVALTQPPAIAVVNPKRLLQDNPRRYHGMMLTRQMKTKPLYPFLDLPGVGVAFKLIQALQTRLDGLPYGQEKWLLDLVALGTICDVVTLVDENRLHVFWGLKVLAKTRRPGLKALMAVSGVEPSKVDARSLGFMLGPRLNAAGRLETARHAQEMLLATNGLEALEKAELLDALNKQRRAEQDEIHKLATKQAETYKGDPVLVVSHPDWNHGIVGIVAAKLLEKYKKPTFVLQEMGGESKGSARSYGGFSAADAIRAADRLITKGGGHKLAAGVTLPTKNIEAFRKHLNDYFRSLQLPPQPPLLLLSEDVVTADFAQLNEGLLHEISQLEPFGNGNPEPIVKIDAVQVVSIRRMGNDGQHLKLSLQDYLGGGLDVVAFSADESWFVEPGEVVSVWIQPLLNEWRGVKRVEGRLVRLEMGKDSGEE
ncbi:single-stranded-DNA-specific exonuclease [Candidatus Saccharimonas aalborgensis]|uniref:Single-stranded-DNA-specific exonuclease RecJ n=1 Tax=Candidatus Saccharimonas aalborgensis TaxID=1332188 RepID=R4PXC2_9BACT|nr:DHHA1 domain-containing protein [Candidatus Saccharimonas aalborgensis]AGL62417.1 single-stranded-DNA-specific exonuclease [Candidatus Saccharimonas aalborgensis]QQS67920.1 MAG: DHH family phosphoesterase [Candidatus Saccharibacteria bacterium]QQS70260.1 MAG: DHH family phosphoesterase [Candidatus Saccharibacteria bacterium]